MNKLLKGLVQYFLSRKRQKLESAGFTLIELLIVIGILAILVVTVLIALNPAEANKKTRDVKRMKDLKTLEAILSQYVADGNPSTICTETCNSYSAGYVTSQPCNNNWLGVDLCKYTNVIPVDPANLVKRNYVYSLGGSNVSVGAVIMRYQMRMDGSDYEINVLQESVLNISNVVNDGGNEGDWVEAGSNLKLIPQN